MIPRQLPGPKLDWHTLMRKRNDLLTLKRNLSKDGPHDTFLSERIEAELRDVERQLFLPYGNP